MCGIAFLDSQNMAYRLGLHHLVYGLIGLVGPWSLGRRCDHRQQNGSGAVRMGNAGYQDVSQAGLGEFERGC
jgi:hypothetical protein